MTDHEWVDWVIARTEDRTYSWKRVEDEKYGTHYRGENVEAGGRHEGCVYIFLPRLTKQDNAEFLWYDPVDRYRKYADRDTWKDRVAYLAPYVLENFYEGYGWLKRKMSMSKVHKIERAILRQING